MIGWENDRGAYFIQKLQDKVIDLAEDVGDNSTDISGIKGNIGTMSDLTTTATTLVGAINEVDSDAGSALTDIGNMNNLETSATDLVGAINEVNKVLSFGSIAKTESITLDVANNSRFILVCIGTNAGRSAMQIGYSGNDGTLYMTNVITTGANVTINTSTAGKITVTNAIESGSGTISVCAICFSGSLTVHTGE